MFIPVKSSNIKGYDYDVANKSLAVTFNNGRTYIYNGVGADIVSGFGNASSCGKFFSQNIAKAYGFSEK